MSNLASREVLKGNVVRLEFSVGSESALANAKGVKRFSLHDLLRTTAEAVSKWAESYNADRNKFVDFVRRYDLTVSDARLTYIEVSPARRDDR